MSTIKKLMLTSILTGIFIPVASVHAMNNGLDEEEEQKSHASEACLVDDLSPAERAQLIRITLSPAEQDRQDDAVIQAVYEGDIEGTRTAFEAGAHPHACDHGDKNLLTIAVEQYRLSPEMLTLLLEYNVGLHAVCANGDTPLLRAITLFNPWPGKKGLVVSTDEMVALLIKAKADTNQCEMPNTRNGHRGSTPLIRACYHAYSNLESSMRKIRLLLDAGACLHMTDAHGKTVLDYPHLPAITQLLREEQQDHETSQNPAAHAMLKEHLLIPEIAQYAQDYVGAPCCTSV